jgi:hypothetical protein
VAEMTDVGINVSPGHCCVGCISEKLEAGITK